MSKEVGVGGMFDIILDSEIDLFLSKVFNEAYTICTIFNCVQVV